MEKNSTESDSDVSEHLEESLQSFAEAFGFLEKLFDYLGESEQQPGANSTESPEKLTVLPDRANSSSSPQDDDFGIEEVSTAVYDELDYEKMIEKDEQRSRQLAKVMTTIENIIEKKRAQNLTEELATMACVLNLIVGTVNSTSEPTTDIQFYNYLVTFSSL